MTYALTHMGDFLLLLLLPPLPSPIHNDALRGKKSYKITALCYQISSGIEVTG